MYKKAVKRILAVGFGLAILSGCDLFDDIRVAVELGSKDDPAFLPPDGFTIPGTEAITTSSTKKAQTADAGSKDSTTDAGNSSQSDSDAPIYFTLNIDQFGPAEQVKNALTQLKDNGIIPNAEDYFNEETGILNLASIPAEGRGILLQPLQDFYATVANPASKATDQSDPLFRCDGQDLHVKNADGKNILTLVLPADVITANDLDPSGKLDAYKGIIDQIRITETELLFEGADAYALKKDEEPLSPAQVNSLSYDIGGLSLMVFQVTTKDGKAVPRFPTPTTEAEKASSELKDPTDPACMGGKFLTNINSGEWKINKDYVELIDIPPITSKNLPSDDERLRRFTLEELHSVSDILKSLSFQVALRLDVDVTPFVEAIDKINSGEMTEIKIPVGKIGIRLRYHAFFVTCPQEAALGGQNKEIKCAE